MGLAVAERQDDGRIGLRFGEEFLVAIGRVRVGIQGMPAGDLTQRLRRRARAEPIALRRACRPLRVLRGRSAAVPVGVAGPGPVSTGIARPHTTREPLFSLWLTGLLR